MREIIELHSSCASEITNSIAREIFQYASLNANDGSSELLINSFERAENQSHGDINRPRVYRTAIKSELGCDRSPKIIVRLIQQEILP